MARGGEDPINPLPPPRDPLTALYSRTLDSLWNFLESRTHISKWPYRPQPEFSFNPSYWTGAFVAVGFMLQVLTGLLLLFYYDPSVVSTTSGGPPQAWASTQYIIQTVPFGWLLLTSHLYGAYAVILLAFIHFFRGFYTGVYKRPRELSWMLGTVLLFLMLGMGFTGYLLPYTALSVGATDVGLALVRSVPVIGPLSYPLIQGNGTFQGLLSRMFALHVVLIPVALLTLLYLHVTFFESHGIGPRASSDPQAKRVLTAADDRKLGSWFPRVFLYMLKWGLVYVGSLLLIASAFLARLPPAFGAPGQGGASPEPDWYFLWLYKVADFQYVTPTVAVLLVGLLAVFILFVPWIETVVGRIIPRLKNPRTHPRDRPVVLFTATYLLSFFGLMTVWGGVMPGITIPVPDVHLLSGHARGGRGGGDRILLCPVPAVVPGEATGPARGASGNRPPIPGASGRGAAEILPTDVGVPRVLGRVLRAGGNDPGRPSRSAGIHPGPADVRGGLERASVRARHCGDGVRPRRDGPGSRTNVVSGNVGRSGRMMRGPRGRPCPFRAGASCTYR